MKQKTGDDMSRARLEVTYDGEAVERGVMDVQDLAPALLGIAEACQRANRILNGDRARLSVQVQADMKRGSFHVDLNLVSHVTPLAPLINFITTEHIKQAKDVVDLLFGGEYSVAGVIRRLKGKRPKDVPHQRLDDGTIQLTLQDNARVENITINYNVYEGANDDQIRKGLKRGSRPVAVKRGIDRLMIGAEHSKQIIDKDDAQYFDDVTETPDIIDDEYDETLQVVAFNFEDRNKSKFTADGNAVFTASIDDDEFWGLVTGREYRPGRGDRYLVRLLKRRQEKPRLKTEYHILEVVKVLEPAPFDDDAEQGFNWE